MLRDVLVVVVGYARPRSMVLAMLIMKQKKKIAWVSISMHACDPFPIVMVLRLATIRGTGAPL